MDEASPAIDSQKAYRAGPDAAGATSETLLQRRPRRGQAAAPLAFSGSSWKRRLPIPVLTPGPGTDGNHSCGLRSAVAADEDSAATSSCTTRPSMPPATVTTWPVTWPDRTGDARTTTWAATSSGCATLRRAIVRETRRTCSAETWPRVIGDSVQPGATAFTRARGFLRTASFFRLSSRPLRIADFAAA